MRKDLVAMAVLACCDNLKAQKRPKAKIKKDRFKKHGIKQGK